MIFFCHIELVGGAPQSAAAVGACPSVAAAASRALSGVEGGSRRNHRTCSPTPTGLESYSPGLARSAYPGFSPDGTNPERHYCPVKMGFLRGKRGVRDFNFKKRKAREFFSISPLKPSRIFVREMLNRTVVPERVEANLSRSPGNSTSTPTGLCRSLRLPRVAAGDVSPPQPWAICLQPFQGCDSSLVSTYDRRRMNETCCQGVGGHRPPLQEAA